MRTRSRTAGTTTLSSSRRSPRSFTRRFPRRSRSTGRETRSFTGVAGYRGAVCEFEETCDKPENERTCKPEGLAVELCDAIMRILDYLAYMGVDVEAVLEAKHAYNLGRPYRHGGKKA